MVPAAASAGQGRFPFFFLLPAACRLRLVDLLRAKFLDPVAELCRLFELQPLGGGHHLAFQLADRPGARLLPTPFALSTEWPLCASMARGQV